MCLCSTIHQLADVFCEDKARNLTLDLNNHLAAVRSILTKSKSLSREVRYQVIPCNQRTGKILSLYSVDTTRADWVCERFKDDIDGFWRCSDNISHAQLQRRLACVIIFLRSRLDSSTWVPPKLAKFVSDQKYSELRYAGNKYIKIARRLGGIGSVLWLPLEIPSSTYERYLNMDDEEVINHLRSIGAGTQDYNNFVQILVASQMDDPSLSLSFRNLFVENGDILPTSDRLLMILHAFGDALVPTSILECVNLPQRRWNPEGEMHSTSAAEFGLPSGVLGIFSIRGDMDQIIAGLDFTQHVMGDGTSAWGISPEIRSLLDRTLSTQTKQVLEVVALKLICFACPPCFEGNTTWSPQLREAVWNLLDKITDRRRTPQSLKSHVIEALLYLAERGSLAIRRSAVERARKLLSKSMPYYLHASVALFQSNIHRLDGDLAKSNAQLHDFLDENPHPGSRFENALWGRLHISEVENKIKRYDDDVASFIYKWEGKHPLSPLEVEVTRRLQGVAARFFQSIGDFQTARASLEQHLSLSSAEPIQANTRRLIVGRLADVYCELNETEKAASMLEREIATISRCEIGGRPSRRLLLASVEANIGQGKLEAAESLLQQLADVEPSGLEDVNDQILFIRRLMATARIAHERLNYDEALCQWRFALQRVAQLVGFKFGQSFIVAVVHLSMAHVQLFIGDTDAGKQSWVTAAEILKRERCEYWIPVVATTWLRKIVTAIHQLQGWPLRMMLPGRRPDVTWL